MIPGETPRNATRQGATTVKDLPKPERFLSIPAVAELLGVNRATVYRYIADGSLGPLVNIGRNGQSKTRVPQSALDSFIAERQREVAS